MTHVVYSVGVDTVDPVFFAVVPDAFMTQATGRSTHVAHEREGASEWSEVQDQPLLSPHDRWSF